jgi:hypothetical protein
MTTFLEVSNGGTAEILGFKCYHSNDKNFEGPMFINNESNLQVLAGIHVNYCGTNYASWITEIKDGVRKDLKLENIKNGGMYYKGRSDKQ